jgi:hypothetical protein
VLGGCGPWSASSPEGVISGGTEPGQALPASAAEYLPLETGSYWVYDVTGPAGSAGAFKQVLVTDQIPARLGEGSVETVVSVIDHSVPRELRPDEPTIIRQGPLGFECLDCGGLLLPVRLDEGSTWHGADAALGALCRIVDSGLSYQGAHGSSRPAIAVACVESATGLSSTRIYAKGIGPVLSVITSIAAGNGPIRIERLREHRVLDPNAPFPTLPRRNGS